MIASLVLWRCLFGQSVFNHQPGSLLFVYHYLSCSLEFHGVQFWVMLPELFPTRARGAATGIAALVLNFGTLIVAQYSQF